MCPISVCVCVCVDSEGVLCLDFSLFLLAAVGDQQGHLTQFLSCTDMGAPGVLTEICTTPVRGGDLPPLASQYGIFS